MPESGYRKTQQQVSGGGSFSRYQETIVGSRSVGYTLYFEICAWVGAIPGGLGILLRSLLWPRLFARCGRGVRFGRGVVLRHPGRIVIGDGTVVGEGCVLDARNEDADVAMRIGRDGMLSNYVVVNCKGGTIDLGDRVGLGAHTVVQSVGKNPVVVGGDVMIGPQCYIVGGSSYHHDRLDIAMSQQGVRDDGGVRIADNVWIGAGATLLGGARLESGAIVAASALVRDRVPQNRIVGGVPARIIGDRACGRETVTRSLSATPP